MTSIEFWISECKTSDDNSCYTPYLKQTKDILPDWDDLTNEKPISMKDFLSNYGKVSIPTRFEWYHLVIISNNKILAETTFQVKQVCE